MHIDQAADDKALDLLLDDRENMAIINCSRWPVIKPVTMNTKTELVQRLVEELLNKRLDNIRAMKHGLMVLGFADMCQTNVGITSPLFLYTPKKFLAVDFLNLVSKQLHLRPKEQNTYKLFVSYIIQEWETVPTAVSLEEQGILLINMILIIHNNNVSLIGAVASSPLILRFVMGQLHVPPMGRSKHNTLHQRSLL